MGIPEFRIPLVMVCLLVVGILPAQGTKALEYHRLGMEEMYDDNMYEAIVHFKDALSQNPRYLDPMLQLAEAYYYLDEYDEALRYVSMANPLGKSDSRLLSIHGRILLALGKTEEAAALFRSIQEKEPYNIDALLGLAEFSLAKGDEINALKHFQKSLEYQSKNRRILLSLTLMHESKGDSNLSEKYLLQALDNFPDNALVQALASEYYLRRGQFKDADYHGRTALVLVPGYTRALISLVRLNLATGEFGECLAKLDMLIEKNPRTGRYFYYRGQALLGLGRTIEAVVALERAISLDPGDEIVRLLWEDTLLDKLPENDPARERAAAWHLSQALEYRKKNLYDRAAYHHKRSYALAPYSITNLRAWAEFLKLTGRRAEFREKLVLLKERGVNDTFVKDNLEIFDSLLDRSVSRSWNVDQFTLERDLLRFRMFYLPEAIGMEHPKSLPGIAAFTQTLIEDRKKISFDESATSFGGPEPRQVSGVSEAFRIARSENADYYLMVDFKESREDFQATADLYLGRTGTKIRSYKVYRSGNGRVQGALSQIADSIRREMPLRGQLIQRKVNDGLIDIGADVGIKVGDVLHLVSPDGYVLHGETPGFVFSDEAQVGAITITAVDDLVAVGTIARTGFFDKINLGDTILRDGESIVRPRDATSNFPYLYNQIRGIR